MLSSRVRGLHGCVRYGLLATALLFPLGGATLVAPWLLAARLAETAAGYHGSRAPGALTVLVMGFVIWAFCAGLVSPLPGVALGSWALAAIGFGVLFPTFLDAIRAMPSVVRGLHRVFAIGTGAAALSGLAALFVQHANRAQLPVLGPNALGFSLVAGIFLTLPLLREPWPWPVIGSLVVTVACAAAIGTVSRGALYGLFVGGLAYLWLEGRHLSRRLWLAGGAGVVLGLLLILSTAPTWALLAQQLRLRTSVGEVAAADRVARYVFSEEGNSDRLAIWNATLGIIRAHPWFGVGLGVFPFVVHRHFPALNPGTLPHDVYLDVGAETGIPGGVLFLGILLTALALGFRRRDRYRAGQIAAMVAMMAAEVRDTILLGFHMFLGFLLVLAMLVAPIPEDDHCAPGDGVVGRKR